jgi:hypothetical protein
MDKNNLISLLTSAYAPNVQLAMDMAKYGKPEESQGKDFQKRLAFFKKHSNWGQRPDSMEKEALSFNHKHDPKQIFENACLLGWQEVIARDENAMQYLVNSRKNEVVDLIFPLIPSNGEGIKMLDVIASERLKIGINYRNEKNRNRIHLSAFELRFIQRICEDTYFLREWLGYLDVYFSLYQTLFKKEVPDAIFAKAIFRSRYHFYAPASGTVDLYYINTFQNMLRKHPIVLAKVGYQSIFSSIQGNPKIGFTLIIKDSFTELEKANIIECLRNYYPNDKIIFHK